MRQLTILILISCFAITNLFAEKSENTIKSSNDKLLPIEKGVKIGKLSNGFTYYIRKNQHPENQGHFRLVIKAGSIHEDDNQHGLAHFVEHMCFNGTKNYPKNELLDFLQKTGVRFGADVNASTGLESTQYELPVPTKDKEFIKKIFTIFEDWSHNVTFENKEIDDERGVIMSEWRQRNSSSMRLRNAHANKIYFNSKYAKRNIIGDTSILTSFKYDLIKNYYKDWYRPDLMSFIAVGDFDVQFIENLIKNHFSKLKNPKNEKSQKLPDLPYSNDILVSIKSDKELTSEKFNAYFFLDEYKTNTYGGKYESIKRALYDIMFSERLSEITQKPNPPFLSATAGEFHLISNKRCYYLDVNSKPENIRTGIDAAFKELIRVKKYGFVESELNRAKKELLGSVETAYNKRNTSESSEYVNSYTSNFTKGEPIDGIEFEYEFVKKEMEKINLSEINALANLYLNLKNVSFTLSLPENESVKSSKISESEIKELYKSIYNSDIAKYEDKVSNKPLFSKNVVPGKFTIEDFNKNLNTYFLELSNGAKVVLKQTNFKDNEILFDAFSPGGLSLSSNEDYYSSMISDKLVPEAGVSEFDKTSMIKALAGKNLRLMPRIDELFESMSGLSTKNDLEAFLQLLNLYITEPRNDKNAYNSFMDKIKPYIANRGNNPNEQFNDSVKVAIYNNHFRQQPITNERLNNIDFEKAYNFFKERFRNPAEFTYIFVGDFELEQMKKLLEKYIGSISSEKSSKETWKDNNVNYSSKNISKRFSKGKESRTHVKLMIPGEFQYSRESKYLLSTLVEYLDIKLTEEIREKLSGVYSPEVRVNIDKLPNSKYCIYVDFVCDPKRTDELINATTELFKKIKSETDEVTVSKVAKAQLIQYDKYLKENGVWMSVLSNSLKNNDNPENFLTYKELVGKLNSQGIKESADKYFKLDRLVKVILEPENI
jgi:zinc protease